MSQLLIKQDGEITMERPPKVTIEEYPITYDIVLESGDEGRMIGTCRDLQGVVIDGEDSEDVMIRVRSVIEELLEVQGKPNKNFILRPVISF